MNKRNRLEYLREENNYKKKEIAAILGVSDSVYCRWENNGCAIPTRRIYQLANYYGVNIDYLLGFVDERLNLKSNEDININLVSQRVREMIKMTGFTLEVLAKYWKTSKSTISAYQTGKVLILYTFLIELCFMTHCSIDWALGRTNTKSIRFCK